MIRTKHLIAASMAFCFTAFTVQAQPPNDHCADVTPVALEAGNTIQFSGNNEGATVDGDYAPGSGLAGWGIPVAWLAFTTSECAQVTISYCGSTAPFLSSYFWEVLATACPANEVLVTSLYNNDECPDGQPTIYFNELPAGTYYYPIWAEPGTAIGDYEIAISAVACGPAAPANDICSGADEHALATGETLTITGDNTGATDNEGFGLPVVWESFTLAQCADVTIGHCGSDLALNLVSAGIFMDCPATMYLDTTVIDTCPDGNLIMVFNNLAPGTYWVPVVAEPDGEEGPYTLEITASACAGPAHDHCQGAEAHDLAAGESLAITGDNSGATDTEGLGYANAWESFTLSTCATVTVDYCDTEGFTAFALGIYADCPATDLVLPVSSDTCDAGGLAQSFGELAAGTYWIPVRMDADSALGQYIINVTATACAPTAPANDSCSGAEVHPLAADDMLAITGDNTGATDNEGMGLPVVWESFTLALCADVTIDYCGSDLTLDLLASGIFLDCPATQFMDTTVTDTCADGNPIMVFQNLAPGTYWVPVVMGPEGEAGPYTLQISTASCASTGPANDLCDGAELHELAVGDTLVITGDNAGATDSEGMGIPSVWESFTLNTCADVELSLCGTDTDLFAVVPGIFTDCPATNEIAPDGFDVCPDGNMLVTFTGLAPGTYWMPVIMVNGDEGPYTITLTASACSITAPANNLCADAASIEVVAPDSCATGAVIGDNSGATGSGDAPACAGPGQAWQDVWYTFEAGEAEDVWISLEAGTIAGAGIEVFLHCGDTAIACSMDQEPLEVDVQPDSTYRVRVFNLDDGSPGTFVLCITADGTTGIASQRHDSFQVYPNPGRGTFTFVPSASWTDARISVLDMAGRTVFAERADLQAGEAHGFTLPGHVQAGSYLLQIAGTEGSSTVILMVQ